MKIPKLKKYDLIEVFWKDIQSIPSWKSDMELYSARCPEMRTPGRFHSINSANELILLHSLADDGDADYTIYPVEVITRIRKLPGAK